MFVGVLQTHSDPTRFSRLNIGVIDGDAAGKLPSWVPSIIKLPLYGTPLAVPTINLQDPAGIHIGW